MSISILPHPTTISQFDLARYATVANQLEALKTEHSALQQQIIAALSNGAVTEPGARTASLKT